MKLPSPLIHLLALIGIFGLAGSAIANLVLRYGGTNADISAMLPQIGTIRSIAGFAAFAIASIAFPSEPQKDDGLPLTRAKIALLVIILVGAVVAGFMLPKYVLYSGLRIMLAGILLNNWRVWWKGQARTEAVQA